jgi:RNA recognition motif-containing protein
LIENSSSSSTLATKALLQENTNSNGSSNPLTAATQVQDMDTEDQILLRSVFVKNVDFSATVDDVKRHFKECGEIVRVTIGFNKATSKPLGYCYIEFKT